MSHSVIFSGVQPTGQLHLGNYLGAIRHFPPLQQKGQCLFSIVDLHAMTVHPSPQSLKEGIMEVAAAYIAAGIDVKRSIVFVQSDVAEHSQLQWLLACHTPAGVAQSHDSIQRKGGQKTAQRQSWTLQLSCVDGCRCVALSHHPCSCG